MKPLYVFVSIALGLMLTACLGTSGRPTLASLASTSGEMTATLTDPSATLTSTPEVQLAASFIPPPIPGSDGPDLAQTDLALTTAPRASQPTPTLPVVSPTPCGIAWFTSHLPSGPCPGSAPIQLEAAYQLFQYGAMLWRKTRGYVMLPFDPTTGNQQGVVAFYPDELTIHRDTSATMSPPTGLLAPSTGFGFLWRGDIFEQPGLGLGESVLGWATAPEISYTTVEQAGTQPVMVDGITTQLEIQLFRLPDGRILELSRLALANQPTSIIFIAN
jgi:hypothetical protein